MPLKKVFLNNVLKHFKIIQNSNVISTNIVLLEKKHIHSHIVSATFSCKKKLNSYERDRMTHRT